MAKTLLGLVTMLLVVACHAESESPQDSLDGIAVSIGDTDLTVWLADEADERRRGLSDLDSLPDGIQGMLFAYSSPVSATFSMRDTRFRLDLWWFDESGVLVGSAEMGLCDRSPCTTYRSPGPVAWALETAQGEFVFSSGDRLSTTEMP